MKSNLARELRNDQLKVDSKESVRIQYQSVITCPVCDHKEKETMPIDACQFFYECKNCHTVIRPKQGDCCVYCSYGSVRCPSKQQGSDDCC